MCKCCGGADKIAEDPSEFFTMIFGGEAFVDWCVATTSPSGGICGYQTLTRIGLVKFR